MQIIEILHNLDEDGLLFDGVEVVPEGKEHRFLAYACHDCVCKVTELETHMSDADRLPSSSIVGIVVAWMGSTWFHNDKPRHCYYQ
jgi:hypothetical protein